MAMSPRKAALEAGLKIFLMGLFWLTSLWCLKYLPFNWTRTATQFATANIAQEPVFHIIVSVVVLTAIILVAAVILIWWSRRGDGQRKDSTAKHACEIIADLSDTAGCALALLMFAFLTIPFTASRLSVDIPTFIVGPIVFLLMAYGLLFVGKRYAA